MSCAAWRATCRGLTHLMSQPPYSRYSPVLINENPLGNPLYTPCFDLQTVLIPHQRMTFAHHLLQDNIVSALFLKGVLRAA